MTALPPESENPAHKLGERFDPDHYRMTIGEHLEELRSRLIKALAGFFICVFGCMIFGEQVVRVFVRPLIIALETARQNPQIYYTEAAESFMVYIKVSLISAAVISGPWLIYQLWQFIAAGLYPRERKYITKYLPLSIALLISGMLMLYFLVLPLMLTFFLEFNFGQPGLIRPAQIDPGATTQPAYAAAPSFDGDPPHPVEGQMWYDRSQHRLKLFLESETRVVLFVSTGLATPLITLATYIDMVVGLLLSFGLAFQMPLVVLALVRIGIVEVEQFKKMRRIVYFSMSIVAGFIVPDVVTGMVALLIPLILLFEMGLWLAREPARNADDTTPAP
jgi:sec-independent protein translocase protein TatC